MKRLYMIDSSSLYQTAQTHYRGKVDYAVLMDKLRQASPESFEAVLFHEEPPKGGSNIFQSLTRSLGYRLVVVPPWRVGGTVGSSRSLPVHLAAYLLPRVGEYTHFDFVSGEVDYSPLSRFLISVGKQVRFWLFADRIPAYDQGEAVFHSLMPLNESFIMAQEVQMKRGDAAIPDLLDVVPKVGCVEIEPSESKAVLVEVPGFSTPKVAPKSSAEKAAEIDKALDAGSSMPKGCTDI